MTANNSITYLDYMNRLIDGYNIIILLIKNPFILIILLWPKKLRYILKLLNSNLTLLIESRFDCFCVENCSLDV